jgi:nucleotide-binding universal stress UspA family protein
VQTVETQCRAAEVYALHYLEAVGRPLQQRGWCIRPLVRLGEPAAEILAAATAEGVRAILIASRIPRGFAGLWRAQVLQHLLAHAPMPVLVFHPGRGMARTAAAVDG